MNRCIGPPRVQGFGDAPREDARGAASPNLRVACAVVKQTVSMRSGMAASVGEGIPPSARSHGWVSSRIRLAGARSHGLWLRAPTVHAAHALRSLMQRQARPPVPVSSESTLLQRGAEFLHEGLRVGIGGAVTRLAHLGES